MRYNIYKNGKKINCIVADKEFCDKYCANNGYTYSQEMTDNMAQAEMSIFAREDEIDTILIDQEYRLTLLELGVIE